MTLGQLRKPNWWLEFYFRFSREVKVVSAKTDVFPICEFFKFSFYRLVELSAPSKKVFNFFSTTNIKVTAARQSLVTFDPSHVKIIPNSQCSETLTCNNFTMVAHFNLISLHRTRKYRSYDITEFQISRSKVKVTRGHNS